MYKQFLQYASQHPEAWLWVAIAFCFFIALVVTGVGLWLDAQHRAEENEMADGEFGTLL